MIRENGGIENFNFVIIKKLLELIARVLLIGKKNYLAESCLMAIKWNGKKVISLRI